MLSSVGKGISWLNVVLVVLITTDVILRYAFSTTPSWIVELEWHIFSLIFLLASAWSLQEDRHVRVDVFYSTLGDRRRALIDLAGHIILLIPWCIALILTSFKVAMRSYRINEGSPNAGGLPYLWIIKFTICIGFTLLLVQAVIGIITQIKKLKSGDTWR